jgi:transglutaminase/protease-like cytokinesis protein 3
MPHLFMLARVLQCSNWNIGTTEPPSSMMYKVQYGIYSYAYNRVIHFHCSSRAKTISTIQYTVVI